MFPWIVMAVELLLGVFILLWMIDRTEKQIRFWKMQADGLKDELLKFGTIGGVFYPKYHVILFGCDETEMRVGMKRVVTQLDKGDNERNFQAMGRIVHKWHDHIVKSMGVSDIPNVKGNGEGI